VMEYVDDLISRLWEVPLTEQMKALPCSTREDFCLGMMHSPRGHTHFSLYFIIKVLVRHKSWRRSSIPLSGSKLPMISPFWIIKIR